MKISFAKITNNQMPFELNSDGLNFNGELKRINQNLVSCKGNIVGEIAHNCDRCGEDINLKLDEDVNLILSDGIYKDKEENLDDVVEFFDGFINLEEVLTSEIEAFKSDYFYCDKCKNL
ncbi:YceD family protein [uncultured Campylobacter sp.]|uniref:YceD family protein n=1 Tax=uncultured Campylobacter sp. TaxID=218934 RepID=UPI00260569F6|nr:YceD family protein [uncultured Campylobacter sp.]